MNAQELNKILQQKKVSRTEAGTTPGWIVMFFENDDPNLVDNDGKPVELYLTVFVGGFKFDHEEWLHFSNCALHFRPTHGSSSCCNIRDYSTPMPIAAANTITLKHPALCDAADQRGNKGHCTKRVAENGMFCQEHYEKSQLCDAESNDQTQTEVNR